MHRMWRASCLITFDKSSGKGRGVYRAGNDLNYGFVEGTAKGPFLVNKGMLIEQPSVAHSRIAVTRPKTLPRSRRILQRQVEMPLTSKIKVMMSPPGRILRERDQRKTSADHGNKVAPSKAKAPGSERC
jgi:hypothetical protein